MGTSRVADDGGRGLPALDPAVPTVDGACCASGETLAMAAPHPAPAKQGGHGGLAGQAAGVREGARGAYLGGVSGGIRCC